MAEETLVLSDSVNEHYLEKVMDLAEDNTIAATEDIFDARGTKLISEGARISRSLQEKLIVHRLAKPLESSIAIEGGIDLAKVVEHARKLSAERPAIGHFVANVSRIGADPFEVLLKLQFGNAMGLMLTIMERGGDRAFTHSVVTSLISICLANKLGCNESIQQVVAMAGLLHDAGELYIDPKYIHKEGHLLPHEWRHLVVHPRIGQALLEELDDYPKAVGLAVGEHHERYDGGGYPRQLVGEQISKPGQILSVSDTISSLLMLDEGPLERAELALKIMPFEHPYELVSAVTNILRSSGKATPILSGFSPEEAQERVRILSSHIKTVAATERRMNELAVINSAQAKELTEQAHLRIDNARRCFNSTGLSMCADGDAARYPEILFEAVIASKEIQWRLRDIARDLALHLDGLEPDELEAFAPLISMLDSEPDARQLVHVNAETHGNSHLASQNEEARDAGQSPSKLANRALEPSVRTLLLVDDEPSVLAALARTLRPLGYRILKAPDAFNAMDMLLANEVGVIVSDHRMPGMTGVELLSRVKTMYPGTIRIILSGYADVKTVTDAIRLGAIYKFLTKPWDHEELVGVLDKAFQKFEEQHASHAR